MPVQKPKTIIPIQIKGGKPLGETLAKTPITGTSPSNDGLTPYKTTDYIGNFIYEDNLLKRILIDNGYIENNNYYFYIQDHLSNNRIVADANGVIEQSNQYYPFGLSYADDMRGNSNQPYKYNSKELDENHNLNWYDYSARYFDPAVPRFTSVDPHAENYYSSSPYAYVLNNPLRYLDPMGTDTVPSNEIWRYDNIINWSSDGSGIYSDNFSRAKNKDGELFHLHLITTGENEGNYIAIQQYGKATIEIGGREVEVDLYDQAFIIGKDRVDDFKAGETKEDGKVVAAKRFASSMGVDGKKSMMENIVDNYISNWDHPLKVIDYIGNAFVTFTKPRIKPRVGGTHNSSPQVGKYYHNYTPLKGTKNNPLKGKEIIQRLK